MDDEEIAKTLQKLKVDRKFGLAVQALIAAQEVELDAPYHQKADDDDDDDRDDEEATNEKKDARAKGVNIQGPGSTATRMTCIQLPKEAADAFDVLPGIRSSSILVRDCYPKIYDEALASIRRARSHPGVLVTCTPSAGKSVFLTYVMWRLLKEDPNRTLILQTGDNEKIYVWIGGQAYAAQSTFDLHFLRYDPDVWYLMDTVPEDKSRRSSRGPTFLVAPCKREFYKYYQKARRPSGNTFYLPTWEIHELANLVTLCDDKETTIQKILAADSDFLKKLRSWLDKTMKLLPPCIRKDMQEDTPTGRLLRLVTERYLIVGGLPRLLFDGEPLKRPVEKALASISSFHLQSIICSPGIINSRLPHMLAHMVPVRNFREYRMYPASPYIYERLLSKFEQEKMTRPRSTRGD